METQYGPVASTQSRVSLVGSDTFVVPGSGITDDYVTDRRRRGKIERKSLVMISNKDKMPVSGYARQYCDKDKQSYYYKVREHIPQLYDTRGGQPEGKIVPDRLFQTLVQASQTPINGNFMRIVGRSQAEDPRGRFNPADYMTSATTGLSEGFKPQKSVNTGEKTFFGQPVDPPAQGQDPSKPSGQDPGDIPPPRGGPSGGDDDDDGNSGGGGGYLGLDDDVDSSVEWLTEFIETSVYNTPMSSRRSSVESIDSFSTGASTNSYTSDDDGAYDDDDVPSMSSGDDVYAGDLQLPPEMREIAKETPVDDFKTTAIVRRSTRNRNQVYTSLNENDMANQSGSVIGPDYSTIYRPAEKQEPVNLYPRIDGPSSARPRINPRRNSESYMLDDHPGNVFQNDRKPPPPPPSGGPSGGASGMQMVQFASSGGSSGESGPSGSSGNSVSQEQMRQFAKMFAEEFSPPVKVLVDKMTQTGEVSKEDVKNIQRYWYSSVTDAWNAIGENSAVKFFKAVNGMRGALNGMLFVAKSLGVSYVLYNAYQGGKKVMEFAGDTYQGAVKFAGDASFYMSGYRPKPVPLEPRKVRGMLTIGSEESLDSQLSKLMQYFPGRIKVEDLLQLDDEDQKELEKRPWWAYSIGGYGHPGVPSMFTMNQQIIDEGLLRQRGLTRPDPRLERFLANQMARDSGTARARISAEMGSGTSAYNPSKLNAGIIAGMMVAGYMGPQLVRKLIRKFQISAGQQLPSMKQTMDLEEQSEEIENKLILKRPQRKRKVIYDSLNETSMSKKSGMEKEYSDKGV